MKISFVRVTFEPHLQLTKDIDEASSDMDTITNTHRWQSSISKVVTRISARATTKIYMSLSIY